MAENGAANTPPAREPPTSDRLSRDWLNAQIQAIETHLDADAVTIYGPIEGSVDHRVRIALEGLPDRRKSLLVIIDTLGGIIEIAERIVKTLRFFYSEVRFLVPDRAMSAGTVLVMSGDAILMDHFACLGPVDPQLPKDGRLVPALSYLAQYHRLIERAEQGKLTSAELVLLQDLDLAELHQYELAGELSVKLIQDWLVRYKFKDWKKRESNGKTVTKKMKENRALSVARALNDHERWGSHGRTIDRETLRELKLKIDNLEDDLPLSELVGDYFWFFRDFMARNEVASCVHSRAYL